MKLSTKLLAGAASAFALASIAAPSYAAVSLSYSLDGGAVTAGPVGADAASFNGSIGLFNVNIISGTLEGNPILDSNVQDGIKTFTGTSHTLDIWVTATEITDPVANPMDFITGFQTNSLSVGWTLFEQAWLSPHDLVATDAGFLADVKSLGSATMIGCGLGCVPDSNFSKEISTGAGPYSITTEYLITAKNKGSDDSTITIGGTVPEPATWGLMLVGFGGMGALLRNRRRTAAVAA